MTQFNTKDTKDDFFSYQEPDGGGEPRVGLHHLGRLLLDDEGSGTLSYCYIKVFICYIIINIIIYALKT